ncbi:MAG: hypothetical protein ISS87_00425 [Candidatus Pacebacteria bacterium]|nr:hypothetical protein [Candidatus Paceibacterota bacterium]
MVSKVEKLLRKVAKKDRKRLLEIMKELKQDDRKNLNVKKIKNTNFYKLRSGRFRIIFHYNENEIVIDSIKLRNEKNI